MTEIRYALAELAAGVLEQLRSHGTPCWFTFGRRRYSSSVVTENEVAIREAQNGDTFGPTPRAGGNPTPLALRHCGAVATITGRSTATGADEARHRAVVNQLLHATISAILTAGVVRGIPATLGRGGFVDDPKQSSEYGARYVLSFSVPEVISSATTWATAADVPYFGEGKIEIAGTEYDGCAQGTPPEGAGA